MHQGSTANLLYQMMPTKDQKLPNIHNLSYEAYFFYLHSLHLDYQFPVKTFGKLNQISQNTSTAYTWTKELPIIKKLRQKN